MNKSSKKNKIATIILSMTLLCSTIIVGYAQTTLTDTISVSGAKANLLHRYSWASVYAEGQFDNSKKGTINISTLITLKNNKTGNISNPSVFDTDTSYAKTTYTRPSGSYTITHSRSTFRVTYDNSTKSKALGA